MKYFKLIFLILYLTFNTNCYASEIKVQINNVDIQFDVSPIILNDRTLVPMRKIFEELGCNIEWLSQTQTVIATYNSKIIALQINKDKIITSDIEKGTTEVKNIDTTPILYNDRTLVPVRVISETVGHTVTWNDDEKLVSIITE